ncbi:MAG: hypothetical protein AAGJ85_01605, partial [Pseudomonadota bacterium]
MRTSILSIALIGALPFTAFAAPLVDQAKAVSTDGPLYSYEMDLAYSDVTLVATIDPSANEGARITVTSPAKADWPEGLADDLARMEENTDGDIWCKEFADIVPDDAVQK